MVNKKSSWPISRVLCLAKGKVPVIYLRCMSPYNFSGLPSDMGRATLVGVGLHDLTTPKTYSSCVATRLVGSYSTFSPLPY